MGTFIMDVIMTSDAQSIHTSGLVYNLSTAMIGSVYVKPTLEIRIFE
jgi:hypothetical protein